MNTHMNLHDHKKIDKEGRPTLSTLLNPEFDGAYSLDWTSSGKKAESDGEDEDDYYSEDEDDYGEDEYDYSEGEEDYGEGEDFDGNADPFQAGEHCHIQKRGDGESGQPFEADEEWNNALRDARGRDAKNKAIKKAKKEEKDAKRSKIHGKASKRKRRAKSGKNKLKSVQGPP